MSPDFQPILNHVALLVRSVEQSAEILRGHGFTVGPRERWDGEGTLEIYVGEASQRGKLLLMEPYKEGVYQRALNRRGPGLHHIAVDVNDLEGYVDSLSSTGWFLHPKSVQSITKQRTAWVVRPGVPALFEIQQRERHSERVGTDAFITQIAVPVNVDLRRLIPTLGCGAVVTSVVDAQDAQGSIWVGAKKVNLSDLLF